MKYTIIAIILAAALVAGVAFLVRSKEVDKAAMRGDSTSQKDQQGQTGKPSAQPQANTETTQTKGSTTLAEFKFPAQGAPKEEFDAFNKKVYDTSVATNKIEVTNCTATPLVVRVKAGEQFSIRNNDSVERKVSNLGSKTPTVIAPQTEIKISLKDAGVYGFGCEISAGKFSQAGIVAVMNITQ